MAVAAVGVFAAYADASRGPTDRDVVAARSIRVGEALEASDLRLATGELPDDATGTFEETDVLVGRVALGPIREGEIVQAGSVTDDRNGPSRNEIALTLPRAQVAVGRLKQGERVDVFVTRDDRTTSVVRGAQVVQIGGEGEASLTSDRELTIVVAVGTGQEVAALVHALRTGEVTVVRSTFARPDDRGPLEVESEPGPDGASEGAGSAGG
jgi:Flp pilus assembly protein CpaB